MTVSIANLRSSWSNVSVTYTGLGLNVNTTAYATGSFLFKLGTFTSNIANANVVFSVDPTGAVSANTIVANTLNITSVTTTTMQVSSIQAESISSNTVVRDSKGDVRDLPITNKILPYAINLGDTGEVVTTNTTIFVPNSVFFSGNAVSIVNNSAASITITQNSSVTMYLSGTATTGNRTLAQRGAATILCIAANTFIISGSGLS